LALAKISSARLGVLSKRSFRVNPGVLLSSPSATADSASNFVKTAITGTDANSIISHCVENVISQHTVVSVALREKPFLSGRNRSVILIHWDAIPVKENITIK
jgi:hypothetical protein